MGVAVLLDARTILIATRKRLLPFLATLDSARILSTVLCYPLRMRWWRGLQPFLSVSWTLASPAARCGEDSFNGPLLDFENSLLASESGYSLHCLNSPNSLIRHPSMHAPSLARELIVGRGGVIGAVGCREGEVVHVLRCDEDDACMDDVNSVIQGYWESCNCMFISGCSA